MRKTAKKAKKQARIAVIVSEIKVLQENINELQLCLDANKTNVSGPYPHRIDKPGYIPLLTRQFNWTIKNLTDQVNLLERERLILIEYGV